MTIPRIWNHTQHWSADIMLNKATWFFIFTHKFFFQGKMRTSYVSLHCLACTLLSNYLISSSVLFRATPYITKKHCWENLLLIFFAFADLANDWSTKNASELLSFIPYEWALNICLRDFEMIWMANEYNWIDCSTIWQENSKLSDFL